MAIGVWKIGGSLLNRSDLPTAVVELLSTNHGERPLLIVGGGGAADVVRHWDQVHQLSDATAHGLAIAAMTLTARLFVALVPHAEVVDSLADAVVSWSRGRWPVLNCAAFLQSDLACCGEAASRMPSSALQPLETLKPSWETTSDSIAAWVTLTMQADRLVLVKSTDPPPVADNADGFDVTSSAVDAEFWRWAPGIRQVDWVNLRRSTRCIPWRISIDERNRSPNRRG